MCKYAKHIKKLRLEMPDNSGKRLSKNSLKRDIMNIDFSTENIWSEFKNIFDNHCSAYFVLLANSMLTHQITTHLTVL